MNTAENKRGYEDNNMNIFITNCKKVLKTFVSRKVLPGKL